MICKRRGRSREQIEYCGGGFEQKVFKNGGYKSLSLEAGNQRQSVSNSSDFVCCTNLSNCLRALSKRTLNPPERRSTNTLNFKLPWNQNMTKWPKKLEDSIKLLAARTPPGFFSIIVAFSANYLSLKILSRDLKQFDLRVSSSFDWRVNSEATGYKMRGKKRRGRQSREQRSSGECFMRSHRFIMCLCCRFSACKKVSQFSCWLWWIQSVFHLFLRLFWEREREQ